jgi:hypothetical protein
VCAAHTFYNGCNSVSTRRMWVNIGIVSFDNKIIIVCDYILLFHMSMYHFEHKIFNLLKFVYTYMYYFYLLMLGLRALISSSDIIFYGLRF